MTWPPNQPFERILAQARDLEPTAMSLLYSRFLPTVYRFIHARVSDPHQAEDVTAETFLAMVEHISQARAQDELSFAAWILGVARNKVLMYYRSSRTHQADSYEPAQMDHRPAEGDEGDPLAVLTAREHWQEIVAALNQLTDDQRTVVLYRCILGYSSDDVAKLMGKNNGTVRALQFRALASLARILEATSVNGGFRKRQAPSAKERGSQHGSSSRA
ncbi:MAG TPA: RNA polymerase sigma factor [Ktedonobacterales bacterium]